MNLDILSFRNLAKTAYPGVLIDPTIEMPEDGFKPVVATYKLRAHGAGLNEDVEVEAHSPTAAVLALKVPLAKSRRRHDTRVALDKIFRTYDGYTHPEREQMRNHLIACRDVPTFRNLVATYNSDANRKAYGETVRPAA